MNFATKSEGGVPYERMYREAITPPKPVNILALQEIELALHSMRADLEGTKGCGQLKGALEHALTVLYETVLKHAESLNGHA